MQVGEQRVAGLEARDLVGLGLLDLDDQLGLAEHRLGVGHDPRTLRAVVVVPDRRPLPRPGLHDDLVTTIDQLTNPRRGQRHPGLVGLDLGGNANLPWWTALCVEGRVTIWRPRRASQNSMRSRAEPRSRQVSSSTLRMR